MNLPERLTKCPRTPECTAKVVFRDSEGNLFRLDARSQSFEPHKCNAQSASELPAMAYVGEWFNKRTRRTRFIGPVRMRKSAEIPPKDEGYRKRGSDDNWELKNVYVTSLNWQPVTDLPSTPDET